MIKALPPRLQSKGRKISAIVAGVLGSIFCAALVLFICITVATKKDSYLEVNNTTPVSLKEIDDGYIYSTKDNKIVINDFEMNVKETIDVESSIVDSFGDSFGKVKEITSLNYSNESESIYVTVKFDSKGDKNYLYKFDSNDSAELNTEFGYLELQNPISAFTETSDGTIYISVRSTIAGHSATSVLHKLILDENKHVVDESKGYYFRIIEEELNTLHFSTLNPTIYQLYVDEDSDVLYAIFNNGLISFDCSKSSQWPDISLDKETISSSSFDFNTYCFYSFANQTTNNPAGSIVINNTAYLVTQSGAEEGRSLIYFDFDDLEPEVDAVITTKAVPNIYFSDRSPTNRNSFFYSERTKIGVVITNSDIMICLDMSNLSNISVKFEATSANDINDVVVLNEKDVIYLCSDDRLINNELQLKAIKIKDIKNTYFALKYGKYTPSLLFTSCISVVFFILALLCAIKPMFLEKFFGFLDNFKKNIIAYIILIICLTLLGFFCYYPAVGSITMSFFRYQGDLPIVWNNFGNYKAIFFSKELAPKTWRAFLYMVMFLGTDIITAIIPPLIFAFFLTVMRGKKFSAVVRTLLFLPSVIPGVTKMVIWKTGIYGEYGILQNISNLFSGEKLQFFAGNKIDFFYLVMMGFPFVGSYLVFYGALMNIPSSYYEAAELEGLNVWKRFFKIDIPLIKPQIKYIIILTIVASVQNYGRTFVMSQGNSYFNIITPVHMMYGYMSGTSPNYGYSSAIATVLFILLFFATLFNLKKQKEKLGDAI